MRTPPRDPTPGQPPQSEARPSRPSDGAEDAAGLEAELARVRAERDELAARERAALASSQTAQRRLRAIEYVTEAALEHLDESDLLAEVLRRVRQVLDADAAAVHLLGASGSSLVLRSWSGLDVASREDVIVPSGLGVVGRAARERAPVVIPDTAAEPELSPAFRQAVRSLLAVPLASRERVLGVLQVGWAAPREPGEDDRRLLQALAARTALALDNARLYGETHYERTRWQAMVESLLDPVIVADAEGRAVYMNPAYERLLVRQGEPPGDAAAGGHEQLFRSDGTPFPREDFPLERAARRGADVRDLETLLRGADGTEIHVVFSASPLRDPRGKVVGAVAVGRDVTAARAAERERERLLDEVQRRAAELEATSEQREDLLRAVSHDLRTPLTSLLLQAHRLASHADADVRRRGEVITSGARRMEALIRDLVESARLETGQIHLDLQPLDLGRWLSDLLARTPALDPSRVALEAEPGALALADPDRLERVVVNLMSNALKYSPPASPVRITVKRAGGEVVTAVSDRGEGIPAEELPKVFGRYYRSQRTRGVEGTGLGLYIARLLVEAHRGRLSAESGVGQGSTFRFTLPAASAEPDAP